MVKFTDRNRNVRKRYDSFKKLNKLGMIIIFIVVALAGAFFIWNQGMPRSISEPLPSPRAYKTSIPSASSVILQSDATFKLPFEVNLEVPFTSQAPHQNWEDPYGEFCEEASVLMAVSYIKGWEIPSSDFADQKMLEIKAFEEERLGYYKDTGVDDTATILKEFYKIDKVKIILNPTVESIKKALSEKNVIIVPAAGRQLGNPNFRTPGPIYHMLVIKGYTKDGKFITNDPGTRKGADYMYSPDVIMNAIHDWNGGDVENGRKVMIVAG